MACLLVGRRRCDNPCRGRALASCGPTRTRTRDPKAKDRMLRYFGIILLFALGSGIGSKSCVWLGGRAIWISCGLLLVSFALMFIREDLEENPVIEKDLAEIRQETREIDHALRQELQEQQQELKESAAPHHR